MKNQEKAVFMAMIVKLYYLDYKGQKDIAKITGISQAKVSRLLAEAREIGMVQVKVGQYDPRNTELEKQLVSDFKLNHAVVIKTWKKQQKELHYKNIGYFAAPVIAELIRPNSTICVSAGRQMAHLVNEISPANIHGLKVLQTMGSIGANVTDYDAIEVGRKIAAALGGQFYQLQAPAITPNTQIREVFVSHSQIKDVLNMMSNANIAIVGVGTPYDSVFIESNFLRPDDIVRLEQKNVVGEICGRFYDADGNQPDTKYRNCVIGITLEQLKAIPEVIAITSGIQRVNAILAAIKAGYIKSLVTDEETAIELTKPHLRP